MSTEYVLHINELFGVRRGDVVGYSKVGVTTIAAGLAPFHGERAGQFLNSVYVFVNGVYTAHNCKRNTYFTSSDSVLTRELHAIELVGQRLYIQVSTYVILAGEAFEDFPFEALLLFYVQTLAIRNMESDEIDSPSLKQRTSRPLCHPQAWMSCQSFS